MTAEALGHLGDGEGSVDFPEGARGSFGAE